MASAEEAKEDAASVETTVSQPAQPEPEAPKPVKNKYIYEDTELGEYEQELIDDGGWQCGFCRRINAYYITSCACGHNKDDSDLKHLGKYVDPEDEYYEDDEYYEEEDEVAATETPASQPVTPQAVPTQATVSQVAHIATPVQSGAQPQARPVQPQVQAQPIQPQASVQPQVQAQPVQQRASVQQAQPQAQPVQRQASVQPQVQAQPVQQRASVQQAATPVQPKIQAQPTAKPESPFIDYDDEEPVAATAKTPVQSQVQAQPVQQQAPVQPAQPQVQAQPVQPTPVQPAQPVQQQDPVQPQPAQPAVDNSAQNAATLKSNIEDQILEDLKKNNYSDVAIVRANRKYKELVKKGIMTQDEFNTKMHELLPTEEEPEEEAASDAENAESNE